ncbi:MAG TPA: hypothetical protein VMZ73_05295 [Acidimicrobiales bacterium]|nr:hypothetical protein [Acidimicrobiales bacterium]
MVLERLPEGARTPAVARAVTAPSAVLLAGAGMSAAILGGLPVLAAAGVGVLAWAARVAVSLPRRPKGERINPFALNEPWRSLVVDARKARGRFDKVVEQARPGPLRENLAQLGRRLDDGVHECWRIACQGNALQAGLAQLDGASIQAELDQVRSDNVRERLENASAEGPVAGSLERAEQALESQLSSFRRIAAVAEDARTRLRVLNAQLDEAVARALELALRASDVDDLSPLSADVESLVGELEALRQAVEEATV